jgi:rubrerythrin
MGFKKKKENFICEYCGIKVKGTGYTDHCPNCLWSKHVDVDPGDRRETCQGMMEPIAAEQKGDTWRIYYRCQKCGYRQVNRAASDDNIDKIIDLSANPIKTGYSEKTSAV